MHPGALGDDLTEGDLITDAVGTHRSGWDAERDGPALVQNPGPREAQPDRNLSSLVESLNAIVWECDAGGRRFSYVSSGAEQLLGYPIRRWLEEDHFWLTLLHPDDHEATVREASEAIRAERDHQLEYRAITSDGRILWLRHLIHLEPVVGEVVLLQGITLDITDRVRETQRRAAEHATTAVLAEADGLLDATPRILEGICRALGWDAGELWVVDEASEVMRFVQLWHTEGLQLDAFEAANRETLFRPGDWLPGRTWATAEPHWSPDLPADSNFTRARAAAEAGFRSGFAFPIVRGRRVLGAMAFYTRSRSEPDDDLLQSMGVAGSQIGQFIERKRTEASLRESETRKSGILEAATDCIFTIDDHGRVIELNPAAEQAFGYPRSEALGAHLADLIIPPDLRGAHRAGLAKFRETGAAPILGRRVEFPAMRADGSTFHVELTITKVDLPGSTVFTGFVRDVSDRKHVEDEVRFQKALLESQSEAALDGILVLAEDSRILHWNRRLATIWGVSEDVFASGDPRNAVWALLEQLEDPNAFFEEANRLFETVGSSRTEVRLKDGRILDQWTAPLPAPAGARAWYYRDITQERRAERALRENEERATFLARAGEMLASSLDFSDTFQRLAMLTVPSLADVCVIDLVSQAGTTDRVALAFNDGDDGPRVIELEDRYPLDTDGHFGVAKVLRTMQPELYVEVTDAMLRAHSRDDEQLRRMREFGFRSAMCVPMIARGRVVGVITLVSSHPRRRYDSSSLHLAEELARRVAVALDNASMYRERARIAETLQEGLLPAVIPEIPGLEVAAGFHPEGDGTEVGGDFYDVFEAGRVWGVSIGDVCGKGAGAAVMTTLARYTLRAAAVMHRRPSAVLSMLNGAIHREPSDDQFCTALYATVEPDDGEARITLSCGGHPGPYVLRRNGTVEKVNCRGTVLGPFPDPELRDCVIDLDRGDAVVLYTDGVPEARGPTSAFGEGMLRSLIGWCRGSTAQEISDRIVNTVVDFQKGRPADDIAVLVLRVPG